MLVIHVHRTHVCDVCLKGREHPPVSKNKRWQWHILLLACVMRPTHLYELLGCFSPLPAPHSTDHVYHTDFTACSMAQRMCVCVMDMHAIKAKWLGQATASTIFVSAIPCPGHSSNVPYYVSRTQAHLQQETHSPTSH